MSGYYPPDGLDIPPLDHRRPTRRVARKPSLRWRLRRWILQRLDAWPRATIEPTTEWARMRRAERRELVQEVARLRGLEDRLMRYLAHLDETKSGLAREDGLENLRFYVLQDGNLDAYLAEVEEGAHGD